MYSISQILYSISAPPRIEPVSDPCVPSPCGPNSQCIPKDSSYSCTCLSTFIGSPPNCRPECVTNGDCPSNLSCIRQKCKDPCPGSCGANAQCHVVNHSPTCTCSPGFTGDPFTQCYTIPPKTVQERVFPCYPSPCGANAICKEQNGAGSCICIPEYYGNPYEGCKPECVLNTDCVSSKACIGNKCTDPCSGSCGRNAICQVINHLPVCTCFEGYTGNPFQYCNVIEKRKDFFPSLLCKIKYSYSFKIKK